MTQMTCPLTMPGGEPQACDDDCAFCVPKSLDGIADALIDIGQTLSHEKVGTALDGLASLSDAVYRTSDAIEDAR